MAFPPLFGVMIPYIIPLFSGERKRFAKKSQFTFGLTDVIFVSFTMR